LLLIEIECRWCHLPFCICRRCYRGHVYCSDECRIAGKRRSHRKSQRKYRQSSKGKKTHCEAENRRRHGLSQKNKKKMDDGTSTGSSKGCKVLSASVQTTPLGLGGIGCCHFCGTWGVIVKKFPRRGYGSRKYKVQKV
jgi:hypothetical protein